MVELRVRTRDELAALWLPWCVRRDRPREVVEIDRRPELRDHAMQLRVSDLADAAVRVAIRAQRREDGQSSLDVIEAFASRFRLLAGRGPVVFDAAEVFSLPDGPMLHEGCHRVCALYESSIQAFEIRARVDPVFGPWAIYSQPRLRARREEKRSGHGTEAHAHVAGES